MSSPRPVAWFSRADFVVSRVVLVLVGVVVAVGAFGVPLWRALTGQPMSGRASVDEIGVALGAAGALVAPALVQVELAAPPVVVRALLVAPGVVALLIAISVIVPLWRVITAALAGDPFTLRNVRALQWAGMMVILGGLLYWLVSGVAAGAVTDYLFGDGSLFVSEIGGAEFLFLALGVLLALVAAIFERGVKLEDEVEGLV